MSTNSSPLAEAQPESLDELFNMSPLEREPHEWERLVTSLRAWREKALAAELVGKPLRARKAKSKIAAINPDEVDFSL